MVVNMNGVFFAHKSVCGREGGIVSNDGDEARDNSLCWWAFSSGSIWRRRLQCW